jgi:hypothetical protein
MPNVDRYALPLVRWPLIVATGFVLFIIVVALAFDL